MSHLGETDEFHGGGKSKWGLKPHVYLDSKGAVTHAITKNNDVTLLGEETEKGNNLQGQYP